MKIRRILRDSMISLAALAAAFALSIAFQRLDVEEHITTVFVFAVFLIALFTDTYFYGVAASVNHVALDTMVARQEMFRFCR